MNERFTLRYSGTSEADVASLYAIEDVGLQARCATCHRASPTLSVVIEDALIRLVELGWATACEGTWRCPVCRTPDAGRYGVSDTVGAQSVRSDRRRRDARE